MVQRGRPRLGTTISAEAAATLADLAERFYAGNASRAVDAAIVAWAEIVTAPSSHGLATDPAAALEAYVAARVGRS